MEEKMLETILATVNTILVDVREQRVENNKAHEELHKRIDKVEEKLEKQIVEVEERLGKQIAEVELSFQRQLAAIDKRLRTYTDERIKRLEQDLIIAFARLEEVVTEELTNYEKKKTANS